jgi:hypothetical protein
MGLNARPLMPGVMPLRASLLKSSLNVLDKGHISTPRCLDVSRQWVASLTYSYSRPSL